MKKNTVRGISVLLAVIVILVAIITYFVIRSGGPKYISVTEFKQRMTEGHVESAYIANDTLTVYERDGDDKADARVYMRYEDILNTLNEYNSWLIYQVELRAGLHPCELGNIHNPLDPSYIDAGNSTAGKIENGVYLPGYVDETATDYVNARNDAFASQIKLETNDRYKTSWVDYVTTFLPIIVMIAVAVIIFKALSKQGGGAMGFGKTNAQQQKNTNIGFKDVAGADEEKEELKEIVEFLKNPQKFTAVGAKIPKGVLLVGPPGTGKTLFAKAVAGEAGVPFFSISGSDFVEMFVGVGASRVRDLFEQAKKNQPCIIFIDEIDAVGRQRGAGMGGGHDEREQTLNQLLVHMDGFVSNEGVIVMAATNRADILDPALLRPGRFDRQIYVNKPDVRGREAIFRVHARNKPLSKDIDFKVLSRLTAGFSGADIANLLNEASILCARDNRKQIVMKDIYEGINKVVLGPQKKSRLVTELDKKNTAYHEAGHAIVAKLMPNCDPVHEISIIPRGQAAGYTMMRPDNDDNDYTLGKLKSNIAMTMGGRAAEEIVIKDISAGAAGDIKAATNIARKMVTEWGMSSEIGPVFFGSSGEVFLGRDYGSHASASEQIQGKIDLEVRKLIEEGHQSALDILNNNRDILDTMAKVLIERETIYTEEVQMIMDGKSLEEVLAFVDKNLDSMRKLRSENTYKQPDSMQGLTQEEIRQKVMEEMRREAGLDVKSDNISDVKDSTIGAEKKDLSDSVEKDKKDESIKK